MMGEPSHLVWGTNTEGAQLLVAVPLGHPKASLVNPWGVMSPELLKALSAEGLAYALPENLSKKLENSFKECEPEGWWTQYATLERSGTFYSVNKLYCDGVKPC